MKQTFSQRDGRVPLPNAMDLENLHSQFRAGAWAILSNLFDLYSVDASVDWYITNVRGEFHDSRLANDKQALIRNIVEHGEPHEVLTLIETMLRLNIKHIHIAQPLRELFQIHPVAYFVAGHGHDTMIFRRTSQECSDAIARCYESVVQSGATGAKKHIQNAANHINHHQYPQAIKESISAVESVARTIAQESGSLPSTLGRALDKLGKLNLLPSKEFKQGIEKLYAYTNSDKGIRHALLRDSGSVKLDETLYMFGMCVLLADYLNKIGRDQQP